MTEDAKLTTPPAQPETPSPPPRGHTWLAPTALVLALVAIAGTLGLGWQGYTQLQSLEVQLARRIGEFDAASREARSAAKAANDALADLQSRLMALENRALETQNQQVSLSAMYQELADSADERVVADIEQTLLLAQQQLQMAGNVKAALIGLEAADARLGQLGKPQLAGLRQAILQDMERLKLLPAADIHGVSARLEALMQAVDGLKTEADSEPAPPRAKPAPSGTLDTLGLFSREAWNEIKGLLRIRRLDHPELPLLTPAQSYFLHQNLKLRLLSARLAMLQRDEATFRGDLSHARTWVERYFNPHDPATQAFLASVDDLLKAPVALKDAQIKASLKAVQTVRGGNE
jgi:uroporphyrin-3 C-methyltransferase